MTNLDTKGWEQTKRKEIEEILNFYFKDKWEGNIVNNFLALLDSQLSELTEEIGKMKREPETTGCEVCLYCKSGEACIDRRKTDVHNRAISDVLSYLKGGER